MQKKAVIILAEGFEELEAVAPVDILRRSGVDVIIAGLSSSLVKGARNIMIQTNCMIEEIPDQFDMLILPGGAKGAENLARSEEVTNLIIQQNKNKKWIAAICAAPAVVLNPTGILANRKITCYPDYKDDLNPDVTYVKDCVVIDGNIITSQGAGTALEFSLKLSELLMGKSIAEKTGRAIIYL